MWLPESTKVATDKPRSALSSQLAFRQVKLALLVAFWVGGILTLTQIWLDYQAKQRSVDDDIHLVVQSSQQVVSSALWTLDDQLADVIVTGLIANPLIYAARIQTRDEKTLANKSREKPEFFWSTGPLFGGARTEYVPIYLTGNTSELIGTMELRVDPVLVIQDFVRRSLYVLVTGMFRAVVVSFILFLIFYRIVTRPVVSLARRLNNLKPEQITQGDLDIHRANHQDEISELLAAVVRLVKLAGDRLAQLTKAREQLQQANLDLEKKVHERTVELENAVQSLQKLATTDSLTGLCNRRHFFQLAEKAFADWMRYKTPFSLLMIDADHFKEINDNFGHNAGDLVLCRITDVFSRAIRSGDIAARLGGEEFVLLVKFMSQREAMQMAERIKGEIEALKVNVGPATVDVTVSIGVAHMDYSIKSIEQLVRSADLAMYEAKHQGRNRICEFIPTGELAG